MFSATAIASTGSSQFQPVAITPSRPKATPSEVQTSVKRWRASASRAMDRAWRPLRSIAQARPPFSEVLTIDSARPQPISSSGCGTISRCTACHRMAAAAAKISMPSKPLEKYSALW